MGKRMNNGLRAQDVEVLKAWAQNSMARKPTARDLYIAPSTLDYRLGQIKKHTGLNPKNFFDLHRLLAEIRKEEAREKTDET